MKLTKENYVDMADKAMQSLIHPDVVKGKGQNQFKGKKNSPKVLSTSQIRKLLTMTADIYNDARRLQCEKLDADMRSRIQYLKLHMVYAAGRDNKVKEFVEKTNLLNLIDNIKDDKDRLVLFCHYMEALVAYHRYYGGKDE